MSNRTLEFVPLKYQIHRLSFFAIYGSCCDLLLNLYLWNTKYTNEANVKKAEAVVICFWICTFEIPNTPTRHSWPRHSLLWFAFEFVPLKYQIHQCFYKGKAGNVVICFWICTFEIPNTPNMIVKMDCWWLWFAFEFVPLKYQIHRPGSHPCNRQCCDLLLNLYLWNTKYTSIRINYCVSCIYKDF